MQSDFHEDDRLTLHHIIILNLDPVFVPVPTELHPTLFLLSTFLVEGGVRLVNIAPIQWHSMYLAIFASLVAPFGGFFASGIKVR